MYDFFNYIVGQVNMDIVYIIIIYLAILVVAALFLPIEAFLMAFSGCILGFLFRPGIPVIGQLPFSVVITGGETLNGISKLAAPYAQESLEYMIAGGIIGCIVGYFFKYLKTISKK